MYCEKLVIYIFPESVVSPDVIKAQVTGEILQTSRSQLNPLHVIVTIRQHIPHLLVPLVATCTPNKCGRFPPLNILHIMNG